MECARHSNITISRSWEATSTEVWPPGAAAPFNAAKVCDYCHDRVHDTAGERVVIDEMGGYLELYRRFFRMFHDYATELLAR